MKADFWISKWESKQIGFHLERVNPVLVDHIDQLKLASGNRIFLPLCGKTNDIGWLMSKGFQIAGIELSKTAVEELFESLEVVPKIIDFGDIQLYRSEGLDIFQGDIFSLTKDVLGSVDAIYDRAALIALPEEMRKRYVDHLLNLTVNARQLLICLVYDQQKMDGPPFSIDQPTIEGYYSNSYQVEKLHQQKAAGLRGLDEVNEQVWLLS